jgi:hypothetical protein
MIISINLLTSAWKAKVSFDSSTAASWSGVKVVAAVSCARACIDGEPINFQITINEIIQNFVKAQLTE